MLQTLLNTFLTIILFLHQKIIMYIFKNKSNERYRQLYRYLLVIYIALHVLCNIFHIQIDQKMVYSVADPGFYLRGGVDFVNEGGKKIVESIDDWRKKSFLACFWHSSIKVMLKMNREQSERRKKLRKFSVLGIKNHRSVAVRGARAGCAPLDRLVVY